MHQKLLTFSKVIYLDLCVLPSEVNFSCRHLVLQTLPSSEKH